ncbi:helix-turn-helix transcriptional regulator [Nocardiopsis sp. CNR-923]|uniref:helix-turn-helix domain-containing protein n=1 Tax=Nocardiopsis sp. CNR-923 TaxID=1904965 RepID=UPI00291609CD|nr:helix-turn-helix transcriptional regulator [Nocardiopsis sp. CNR-923]
MAAQKDRPSIERRRFAAELRSMREAAGMTIEEARLALDWSSGRLNHIEGGRHSVPDVSALKALLDLYEVKDPARRDALLALRKEARQRPWWYEYEDVLDDGYVGFEARARRITAFHPIVVHGLLQTPAYAAASARASLGRSEEEIERIVEARTERQKLLARPDAPEFRCVLDEAVLLRLSVAPDLARDQLRHLVDVAEGAETVTLQVLPISVGLHGCMHGSTVLLDYEDERDPSLVCLETRDRGTYLDSPAQVADYRLALDDVAADSLSGRASIDLIKSMITDWK